MTTERRLPIADYSHLEPLPDPPRGEPDMRQSDRILAFHAILSLHFAHRDDVLICGDGYLRRITRGEPGDFAPDMVVAFGVNPTAIVARNGYVISEVGKPPELVLEVGSYSTGPRDYTIKRQRYAEYGVGEYWRFDPSGGRFHDAPMAGDILTVEGGYAPLPVNRDPDGLLWGYSPVLDLELCWDNGQLRFRNPHTKEFLPTPEEARFLLLDADARADNAEARADNAEARADNAETRADNAEARADDAIAQAEAERRARLEAEEQVRILQAELERRNRQDE